MIINITLIFILLICIYTDVKSRKIYNKVIFPSLLFAFTINAFIGGWDSLLHSFLGFLTGLGLLLIPYLMGGMGAGDVKLLALIGALKGVHFVLITSLYMAIVGGIIAIAILLFRKGAVERFKNIIFFLSARRSGVKVPLLLNKDSLKATYPYGVAIAAGAFISLIGKGGVFL